MLTKHQTDVLNKAISIITSPKNNRLLIKGSAGTGKTYILNELIKRLPYDLSQIYVTAPTHKALSVLEGKIDLDVTFKTIHSALQVKKVVDNATGSVAYKPTFNPKKPLLKSIKIILIDESSMISEVLLDIIDKYYQGKVIFIGDEKQLNPVEEENSPVFHKGYPEVELVEIIRQGENSPIIDLSRNLDLIHSLEGIRNDAGAYVFTYDFEKILNRLAEVNGSDELKYLAYTNEEVNRVNSLVRTKLYGDSPKLIEKGEVLIIDEPYQQQYFTNECLRVNELLEGKVELTNFLVTNGLKRQLNTLKVKIHCYLINGKILAIHEKDTEYPHVLNIIKRKIEEKKLLWSDYYAFTELFLKFKYAHAISVHKSQGSTYKNVIINIKNLETDYDSKERKRLLYTAITRASDTVILYNVK